ncbi:MAG: CBS domain-containing protein [Chloroflexaceae bacterium]|nr:CBS domain-containing protein [Chloroflexaceae bacterium]
MNTVRRMLSHKLKGVWTVAPATLVSEAVALMVEKDVGAIVVVDDGAVVGIITERDVVRKVLARGKDVNTTSAQEIMTSRVLYVRPEQTLDECMVLMDDKHIRHLPVLEDNQLLGIVSIRDAIKHVVAEREFMIEQLENYILDRRDFEGKAGATESAPIGR